VVERGRGPSLLREPGEPYGAGSEGLGKELDGHVAEKLAVPGAEDLAHAPRPEPSEKGRWAAIVARTNQDFVASGVRSRSEYTTQSPIRMFGSRPCSSSTDRDCGIAMSSIVWSTSSGSALNSAGGLDVHPANHARMTQTVARQHRIQEWDRMGLTIASYARLDPRRTRSASRPPRPGCGQRIDRPILAGCDSARSRSSSACRSSSPDVTRRRPSSATSRPSGFRLHRRQSAWR